MLSQSNLLHHIKENLLGGLPWWPLYFMRCTFYLNKRRIKEVRYVKKWRNTRRSVQSMSLRYVNYTMT